jgi:hypothetical protein
MYLSTFLFTLQLYVDYLQEIERWYLHELSVFCCLWLSLPERLCLVGEDGLGRKSVAEITNKVHYTLCMSCISLPPPSEVMAPVLYHGHHSLSMLKRPSRIEQLQVDWKKLGT